MSTREAPLSTHIERLSSLRFHSALFSPDLEREFNADADTFRCRRQWLEGLLSIGLYAAFSLATHILFPGRPPLESQLRFGLVFTLLLLINFTLRIHAARWLRESAIFVASGITASLEIALQVLHQDRGYAAHFAIVLFLVFTNTVMRLRPVLAVAGLCLGAGAELLMLAVEHGRSPQAQNCQAAMVIAIGLFTLVGNYSQDREARLAFLRSAQKAELISALSHSNEHLSAAALTDSLTGMANRSALDLYLTKLWSEASSSTEPCSMVMVDIDHFKNLNDRYGHLYGDRVLKRVAHLLSETLRGEDDFIARYGGEEFLVVLPRTAIPNALLIAERLRGVVELAGLPALRSGDHVQGLRATISCGVAGGAPQVCADSFVLIGAADEALYRAKREGRNLVRKSTVPTGDVAS